MFAGVGSVARLLELIEASVVPRLPAISMKVLGTLATNPQGPVAQGSPEAT